MAVSRDNQKSSQNRKIRKFKRWLILILCLGLLTGWGIWEIWRSYHTLIVRTVAVSDERISHPVSIALLGDLHDCEIDPGNESLLQLVQQQSPDLICLDGDMINEDTTDFSGLLSLCKRFLEICPVVYAPGNKELDNPEWNRLQDSLNALGVPVLDTQFIDLDIEGNRLRIGGLYDYTFALNGNNTVDEEAMNPDTVEFLHAFQDSEDYKILLCHRPDSIVFNNSEDYWNLDLVLCAHTHGGQVILPVFGPLWAPDQGFFPQYVSGVTRKGSTTVITTNGLGSDDEHLPRFNNPAEVLMIELGGNDLASSVK